MRILCGRKLANRVRDGCKPRPNGSELARLLPRSTRYRQKPPRVKESKADHRATVDYEALAGNAARSNLSSMFAVSEDDATAIRAAFHEGGELSAAIELRRRFPGITDNAQARICARTIAGWSPEPLLPRPVTRLRPKKRA